MSAKSEILNFDSPAILKQLRDGDTVLFTCLVRQHHRTLITLARGIIGDGLAEEVVQESWLSAYKALPRFEGRSAVKTWLFTIVSNLAKTRLRQEARTVSLEAMEDSGNPYPGPFQDDGHWQAPPLSWHIDSPDKLLEEAQLKKCVEQTLQKLPALQKAVFTLRDLEQESLQSICNILSISDSNVRVLLHRARLKLMQVIEHYQETGTC